MPEKIKITFLGTSGAFPTARRNHPSFLLTYSGENILVDCGEGTQRQLRRAKISPCKIDKILITHWHGDHVLGLPGLLQSLSLNGYNKTLQIYGPRGIKMRVDYMIKAFPFDVKLEVLEISGRFFETKNFYLESENMTHGTPCYAYNFILKGQTRIDARQLKKYKIPSGKHLLPLKLGKDIKYGGKKYSAKNLIFKEKDKKISFVLDTSLNNKIEIFSKNANLLVMESTFASEEEVLAKEHKHMTVKQSATCAKKAKVSQLALVHISDRYENHFSDILKDAKKYFKSVFIPQDLDVVDI